MAVIVVDDQQRQTILEAKGDVVLRDREGRYLGHLTDAFTADVSGITPEDIEIAKRRRASNAPRLTTPEVLARLRQLGESQR